MTAPTSGGSFQTCAGCDTIRALPRRLTLSLTLLALVVPASGALASTVPTLGLKQASTNWGAGFGAIRPSAINFNGDPTSFISKIHWSSWGGSRAVGHGIAGFVWPGFARRRRNPRTSVRPSWPSISVHATATRPISVRSGTSPSTARRSLRASAGWDICTGKLLGQRASAGPVYCPKGQFTTWVSGSVTCAELPGIEDLIDGTAHQGHSAKWISHGWVCGTDLNMGRDPQTVNCQSGNSKVVNFKI